MGTKSEAEKLRLKELKDVYYNADDVVDEYNYEVICARLAGVDTNALRRSGHKRYHDGKIACGSQGPIPVPNELISRAREIKRNFEQILGLWEQLRPLDEPILPLGFDFSKPLATSGLVVEDKVHGRLSEKDEIIEKLHSEIKKGKNLNLLSISGMPGIGKTTVAQLVYNDPKISQIFNLVKWVYVGELFDVKVITRKVLVAFTGKDCELTEIHDLQRKLLEAVRGKMFFLVMDDVWNDKQDLWESFCAPFVGAMYGGIVITTRNKKVAKTVQNFNSYNLSLLSFDDCWSLFKQITFRHNNFLAEKELLEIGEQIVHKCCGLPLIVKAIATYLSLETDIEKWRDILDNDIWDLNAEDNVIFQSLKLSYDLMPVYLKPCFLVLSLFPRGYVFRSEKIIRLWMSVGFLHGQMERVGRRCIHELLQWSMIQQIRSPDGVEGYVLHDLIHKFAENVAEEHFLRMQNEILVSADRNIRYLSVLVDTLSAVINLEPLHKFTVLRILQLLDPSSIINNSGIRVSIPTELFQCLKHLRALDLKDMAVGALPESIGCLKQLRYLGLANSGIEALPESICHLYHLQTLELLMCPIQELPARIKNLVNLRHLILEPSICVSMPHGIGQLTNLRTLTRFDVGSGTSQCGVKELSNLVNLGGELCIAGLSNVSSTKDVQAANLQNKRYLNALILDWSELSDLSEVQDDAKPLFELMLENLRPHPNLENLQIKGYRGYRFPNWLGDACFTRLVEVSLIDGEEGCGILPTLGQLPFLKILYIKSMWSVKLVGRDFCSHDGGVIGFPSLERLEFDDMLNWVKWSGVENGEFCSLSMLRIINCPQLILLPQQLSFSLASLLVADCGGLTEIPYLPSLETLVLKGQINGGIFSSLKLDNLRTLKICCSDNNRSFSLSNDKLKSLEVLVIHGCRKMLTVIGLGNLMSLKLLKIHACQNLKLSLNENLPTTMCHMDISNCPNLHDWERIQRDKNEHQVLFVLTIHLY